MSNPPSLSWVQSGSPAPPCPRQAPSPATHRETEAYKEALLIIFQFPQMATNGSVVSFHIFIKYSIEKNHRLLVRTWAAWRSSTLVLRKYCCHKKESTGRRLRQGFSDSSNTCWQQ